MSVGKVHLITDSPFTVPLLNVPLFCPFFFFFFPPPPTPRTVHLSIFILVINQLHAHNFFVSQQVYFMPLHVSSTCAQHQEVKIALHSLWYHV